jgi:hypothetical protein
MIDISTVHTSGINWESVGTILGGFAGVGGLILAIVGRISKSIRAEIKESVDHLAEVLNERLATKEAVSKLETEVAVLQERDRRRR